MYQTVCEPCVGETFTALNEDKNIHDSHAMVVYLEEDPSVIMGHLPREISKAILLKVPKFACIKDYNTN